MTSITHNRTLTTDDFIIDEEEMKNINESTFSKIVKYCFYPLYLISTVESRLRHFLDYICIILLFGCMLLISASCSYIAESTSYYSYGLISLIVSVLIVIPPTEYFLSISACSDFDFINIYLQGGILKCVIFGVSVTALGFSNWYLI
jgi:hypothetical protein